ncbi:unnamed protein product [Lactuca virosa]|uniref:SMP-LTD domain-containing protein n=1 Tax=Lactuca virosa TaxID=75947 RepID=A0AAU9P2V7_9ASTR|nr:unnamed protein product [Lactuca virosa]
MEQGKRKQKLRWGFWQWCSIEEEQRSCGDSRRDRYTLEQEQSVLVFLAEIDLALYVDEATSELIKANLEQTLEQYRPILLSSLSFSKFTLGTVAPQFTGVSNVEDGGEGITMELEMNWDGNPNIILDIKTRLGVGLHVQVKNIAFTGELLFFLLQTKGKLISSFVYFSDDKILAALNTKIRVLTLDDGEELLKFSTDFGPVKHTHMLDDTNTIITYVFGDKNLHMWKNGSSQQPLATRDYASRLEGSDAGIASLLESMEFCLKLWGLEACVLEDLAKVLNLVHIRKDLVESGHALLNHAYQNQQ